MRDNVVLIYILFFAFLFGCTPKNNAVSSFDKAWAVTRSDSKQSVRKFMESQHFTVTDEDSILIAFDLGNICWCGDRWDMAIVKFDANNKAIGVSLIKGEPFMDLVCKEFVNFLESLYGTSEYDSDLSIWTFRGNEYTNAFMAQYPRTMINVTWNIP